MKDLVARGPDARYAVLKSAQVGEGLRSQARLGRRREGVEAGDLVPTTGGAAAAGDRPSGFPDRGAVVPGEFLAGLDRSKCAEGDAAVDEAEVGVTAVIDEVVERRLTRIADEPQALADLHGVAAVVNIGGDDEAAAAGDHADTSRDGVAGDEPVAVRRRGTPLEEPTRLRRTHRARDELTSEVVAVLAVVVVGRDDADATHARAEVEVPGRQVGGADVGGDRTVGEVAGELLEVMAQTERKAAAALVGAGAGLDDVDPSLAAVELGEAVGHQLRAAPQAEDEGVDAAEVAAEGRLAEAVGPEGGAAEGGEVRDVLRVSQEEVAVVRAHAGLPRITAASRRTHAPVGAR